MVANSIGLYVFLASTTSRSSLIYVFDAHPAPSWRDTRERNRATLLVCTPIPDMFVVASTTQRMQLISVTDSRSAITPPPADTSRLYLYLRSMRIGSWLQSMHRLLSVLSGIQGLIPFTSTIKWLGKRAIGLFEVNKPDRFYSLSGHIFSFILKYTWFQVLQRLLFAFLRPYCPSQHTTLVWQRKSRF